MEQKLFPSSLLASLAIGQFTDTYRSMFCCKSTFKIFLECSELFLQCKCLPMVTQLNS